MQRIIMSVTAGLACALTASASAQIAQNPNACNVDLFKAVTIEKVTNADRMFFLSLVTEENYRLIKDDSKLGGTFVSDDVQINATADFTKFHEERRKEFELRNYRYSSDYARNYLSSGLNEAGLQAYIACVSGGVGLGLWIAPGTSTAENVTVVAHFRPPSGYAGTTKADVKFDGVVQGVKAHQVLQLRANGTKVVSVKRDPSQEFRATFDLDGHFGGVVVVPKSPVVVSREVERPKSMNDVHVNETSALVHKSPPPCLEPSKGWKLKRGSSGMQPPQSGPGAQRHWGFSLQYDTEDKVCYAVWISRLGAEPTSVSFAISAIEKRTIETFQ